MPKIIANVIPKNVFNRRFEGQVDLPEYPKVGDSVWLNIKNRLCLLKVTKRHPMEEGADAIEFDFKRCWFSSPSTWLLNGLLEDDPKWRVYCLSSNGNKVFDSNSKSLAAA